MMYLFALAVISSISAFLLSWNGEIRKYWWIKLIGALTMGLVVLGFALILQTICV